MNCAIAYEFHANNTTFFNNIVSEAKVADTNDSSYTNDTISKKYILIVLENKEGNKTEPSESVDDLSKALRSGPPLLAAAKRNERKDKVKKDYIQLMNAEKARNLNAKRVQEVKAFMKYNYKTTEYLYSEVKRILRERAIYPGPRNIVHLVESSLNKTYLKAMVKCIYTSTAHQLTDQWVPQPNKITWHVVSDPYNDY